MSDYSVSATETTMEITIVPNDLILANGYFVVDIPA